MLKAEACSRVGAHLSKLCPIQEIGPKVGGALFCEWALLRETTVLVHTL